MHAKPGMKIYRDNEELLLLKLVHADADRELWVVKILSENPPREKYVFFRANEELLALDD